MIRHQSRRWHHCVHRLTMRRNWVSRYKVECVFRSWLTVHIEISVGNYASVVRISQYTVFDHRTSLRQKLVQVGSPCTNDVLANRALEAMDMDLTLLVLVYVGTQVYIPRPREGPVAVCDKMCP